jgi:hypothetical protein
MEITKQQIEKMATEYAKQFDYAEDSSPFLDYIAGFEKALSLFAVSGQSEQLVCVCKNRQDQFKRNDVWICGDCEEEIKQTNCH